MQSGGATWGFHFAESGKCPETRIAPSFLTVFQTSKPDIQGTHDMSAKKSIFADIASEIASERQQPDRQIIASGDVLASRGKALSHLGENVVYEQFELVDPAICRPSAENARAYDELSYEACEELINGLLSEGRQQTPAIVRAVDDADYQYEIVAGSRRHWAVSWLRAHSYPDFKYLIDVQVLDDEAAFRISDIENRARADVSNVERARSYQRALSLHYDGNIGAMADRLRINHRTLRTYLDLAALNDNLIAAIGGVFAVKVDHAVKLTTELRKGVARSEAIEAEAIELAKEQARRKAEGSAPIPPTEALRRLIAAGPPKKGRAGVEELTLSNGNGERVLTYTKPARTAGLKLALPAKPMVTREEMLDAIVKLVDEFYPTI